MRVRGRMLPLLLGAALVLGSCSSGSNGAARSAVPAGGVSQGEVLDALGCDRTERGRYMGGPAARFEREIARDCYREDDFVARVHLLEAPEHTQESVDALNSARYGPPYPEHLAAACRRAPTLVRGPDWIVVALTEDRAEELRRLVGGVVIPAPLGMGPIVSYDLPCVPD